MYANVRFLLPWIALMASAASQTNGTQASFDPSVSTTQDWTRWDTR